MSIHDHLHVGTRVKPTMTYIVLELRRGASIDQAIITRKDALDVNELLKELFGKEAKIYHYSVDAFGNGQDFLLNTLLSYRLYTTAKNYDQDLVGAVVHTVTKMLKDIDFVHYVRMEKYGPEYFIVPAGMCERA